MTNGRRRDPGAARSSEWCGDQTVTPSAVAAENFWLPTLFRAQPMTSSETPTPMANWRSTNDATEW